RAMGYLGIDRVLARGFLAGARFGVVLVLAAGVCSSLPRADAQTAGPGSSLSFDGTGAYAEAPDASELNPTGDWTIEGWFKDETPGGYNHPRAQMLAKGDTSNPEVPYFISVTANALIAGLRTGGAGQLVQYDLAAHGVSANVWHHVAVSL